MLAWPVILYKSVLQQFSESGQESLRRWTFDITLLVQALQSNLLFLLLVAAATVKMVRSCLLIVSS